MHKRAGIYRLLRWLPVLLIGSGCSLPSPLMVWSKPHSVARPTATHAISKPSGPVAVRLVSAAEPEPVPAPAAAETTVARLPALPPVHWDARSQPVTLPAVLEIVDSRNPAVNAA